MRGTRAGFARVVVCVVAGAAVMILVAAGVGHAAPPGPRSAGAEGSAVSGDAGAAAELAAFAALEPLAARLGAKFDAREDGAAARALAARAPGVDPAAFGASPRDRVLLARMLALADAARWTARAIWRERRPGKSARAAEDEAAAAVAAAFLRDLESRHPAVGWYAVRLATFLELEGGGGAAALVRHLRRPAPGTLRDAIVRHLYKGRAVPIAAFVPMG